MYGAKRKNYVFNGPAVYEIELSYTVIPTLEVEDSIFGNMPEPLQKKVEVAPKQYGAKMTFDEGEDTFHSNYIIYGKDGKVLLSSKGNACYSQVLSGYGGMEALEVWFPEHEQAGKYVRDLVNWILNSETFGKVFITKDYDQGVENGFKVDIHQPTNLIFMNLAALRYPWESGQSDCYEWYYPQFIDDGFTIEQALYLSVNFDIRGGKLVNAGYNTNHIPFPQGLLFEQLTLGYFEVQKGTMYERSSSVGVSYCWGDGSYQWGSMVLQPNHNYDEENISHLKKKLKR